MIDIHTHILPGMDDGARNLCETLEMIDLAAKSGVTAMVATPHCNIPGEYENYFGEQYIAVMEEVRDAVHKEGIPVNILPGAEVFGTADLPKLLKDGKIMTLNQSKYLLMEFKFDEDPEFVQRLLEEISELNAVPVIAHAERYKFVQRNPEIVAGWRKKGYPVQINKGSFLGKFGRKAKKAAYFLLNEHLVSVVASDAHGAGIRTPYMRDVYGELLMREYPEIYLNMLFKENPRRICMGEPILGIKAKRAE